MLRFALTLLLIIIVARAFWRLIDGVIEGVSGRPRSTVGPNHSVQMVRDPVCGTFVVPDRALTVDDGSTRLFFCSQQCRDKYRHGGRA
jgi:YHS domain-containing protein